MFWGEGVAEFFGGEGIFAGQERQAVMSIGATGCPLTLLRGDDRATDGVAVLIQNLPLNVVKFLVGKHGQEEFILSVEGAGGSWVSWLWGGGERWWRVLWQFGQRREQQGEENNPGEKGAHIKLLRNKPVSHIVFSIVARCIASGYNRFMELQIGSVLKERYQIVRLLGKGGMGEVYLALDLALDAQVAVKVNHDPNPESGGRFLREARLLAALRHARLPRVSDYFVLGQDQYLVMDYIAGQDLEERLQAQGAQAWTDVLTWAKQLAEALDYLHHQQPPIIHRDIKPANIKLSAQGEAVLVDFGIAKSEGSTQSSSGLGGYTPGYAPPEQYGGQHSGPFSDQYALAATLYTLLAGQKPPDSVQRVLGQAQLKPLAELRPDLPAHVAAVLERGLALRPQDRFGSVRELVDALEDAQVAEKLLQKPEPTQPLGVTRVHRQQAAADVPAPKAAPRRVGGWLALGLAGAGVLLFGLVLLGLGGWWVSRNGWPLQRTQPSPSVTVALIVPTETATERPQPSPTATATVMPSQTFTPLPPTPTASATPSPQPSPTPLRLGGGGMVVFSSDRADGKTLQLWGMYVVLDDRGQAVAQDLQQLTFGEGDKTEPIWSPDGRRLAFVAPGGVDERGNDLGLDIWVMDLAGGPALDVTRRKGDDTTPAWSPDGQWIAFTNDGRDDKIRMVYMVRPDGSDMRRLTVDQQEYSPEWSPDMRWLQYVLKVEGNRILYLRSPGEDYATPYPFDRNTLNGRLGQVDEPAWSPDNTRIAYTRIDGRLRNIYSVNTATRGDEIYALTKTNAETNPAWSPDSQWIVFTSQRDGNSEIYIMMATGQKQTNLTLSPGRDQQPAWQPVR